MTGPNEPRESDDVRRVSRDYADRLTTLGIRLTGTERPQDLLEMLEAVDRFESAVESQGGDLMMGAGAPVRAGVQSQRRGFLVGGGPAGPHGGAGRSAFRPPDTRRARVRCGVPGEAG